MQEFCENFNLMNYYRNRYDHKVHIDWVTRRNMMLGIARSFNYLHLNTPPLIHRDLKSLNIFIDRDQAKLGDFGSLRHQLSQFASHNIGTIHWMAPEVASGNQYNEKCDVFSFGIILFEIVAQ